MAAPIAFRASSNAAFTQSLLKQRGLGAPLNPTEEGQYLYYQTTNPSDGAPFGAAPGPAIAGLNAQNFSQFPVLAYDGTLPVKEHFLPGITPVDWPHISPDEEPQYLYSVISPSLPMWQRPNDNQIVASFIQAGSQQWSYWVCVPGPQAGHPDYQNLVFARKARFRVNNSHSGFLASFEIWARQGDGNLGWNFGIVGNHTGYLARNLKKLRDVTLTPFQYFEVDFPSTVTYASPFNSGFMGSAVMVIYDETTAQFSARSGLTIA